MKTKISLFILLAILVVSLSACASQAPEPTAPVPAPLDIVLFSGASDGVTTVTYDASKWQIGTDKFNLPFLKHQTISDCMISPWTVEYPVLPLTESDVVVGNISYKYSSTTIDNKRYDAYTPDPSKYNGIVATIAVTIPPANAEECSNEAQTVLATLH